MNHPGIQFPTTALCPSFYLCAICLMILLVVYFRWLGLGFGLVLVGLPLVDIPVVRWPVKMASSQTGGRH